MTKVWTGFAGNGDTGDPRNWEFQPGHCFTCKFWRQWRNPDGGDCFDSYDRIGVWLDSGTPPGFGCRHYELASQEEVQARAIPDEEDA